MRLSSSAMENSFAFGLLGGKKVSGIVANVTLGFDKLFASYFCDFC